MNQQFRNCNFSGRDDLSDRGSTPGAEKPLFRIHLTAVSKAEFLVQAETRDDALDRLEELLNSEEDLFTDDDVQSMQVEIFPLDLDGADGILRLPLIEDGSEDLF